MPQRLIYDAAPLRIYWETTNACDLACRHCRAEAAPEADPRELSTTEGRALLEALRGFGSPLPHLVFTGGDPLKRADLFELIDHARGLGFHVSVAPSATPLLTEAAIGELAAHGVDAISLSLDAATAERHDAIRQVPGTFERTLRAAAAARAAGLPFQVNTLVCEETADDLPRIHEIVRELGAARWSLFFLVTVGRGNVLAPVTPERAEEILSWIAGLSSARMATGRGGLVITTTEAPQIRRVVAERMKAARPGPEGAADAGSPPPPRGHATHAGGARRQWHPLHLERGRHLPLRFSRAALRERQGRRRGRGLSRRAALPEAARPHRVRRPLRPLRARAGVWWLARSRLVGDRRPARGRSALHP